MTLSFLTSSSTRNVRPDRCCRRKSHHHLILLAILLTWIEQVIAFQPLLPPTIKTTTSPLSSSLSSLKYANSAMEDEATTTTSGSNPASFQQRMRNMLVRQDTSSSTFSSTKSTTTTTNPFIQEVSTLEEYKNAITSSYDDNDNSLVVVRFYAKWCRSCRAMAPGFNALTKHYSNSEKKKKVKFVQVAITDENTNLFKGLNIPSIPYGHIYHSQEGLVEEQRLTRNDLQQFRHIIQDYTEQECSLIRRRRRKEQDQQEGDEEENNIIVEEVWSTESPYRI